MRYFVLILPLQVSVITKQRLHSLLYRSTPHYSASFRSFNFTTSLVNYGSFWLNHSILLMIYYYIFQKYFYIFRNFDRKSLKKSSKTASHRIPEYKLMLFYIRLLLIHFRVAWDNTIIHAGVLHSYRPKKIIKKLKGHKVASKSYIVVSKASRRFSQLKGQIALP